MPSVGEVGRVEGAVELFGWLRGCRLQSESGLWGL